ncbi:MAG: ERAP1-like C-terminal domain-containing protein, partial [Pseudomonadota bacterium]|nr:ERAP1-like C-terminal domain-containing protein [Pseudomonadota bacterium]
PEQFKALSDGFNALPVVDQLGLMMDAGALSAVGLQPVSDSLDLTAKVPLDASPNLWQMVAGSVGGIDNVFEGNPKREAAARKYALSRLSPKFQQLGWENREGDSAATKQLRSSLIGILSTLGDEKVLAEARTRFAASATEPKAMPPELRRTILGIVARNADAATWDKLRKMAQDEKSSMIRDQYYGLLAATKDKALAQRALDMALTAEPGATNSAGMISSVSREHSEMAFDFALAHREQVDKLVDSTSRARFYPGLGYGAKDLKMVGKIKAYADAYLAPTSRRDAETVMNAIETGFKLREQRLPQIDAWLKKNGY